MHFDELADRIEKLTDIDTEKIKKVLLSFNKIVADELAAGRNFEISDFGQFSVESKSARKNKQKSAEPNFRQDLSRINIPKKILLTIPEHIAKHYQAVAVSENQGKLTVAMANPYDEEAVNFIKNKIGRKIDVISCNQQELNHILDQYSNLQS